VAYLCISVDSFMSHGKRTFKLSQPHLTQRVINSIGLKDSRLYDTPAEPGKPLTKDNEGQHQMYHWSFQKVVGTLNYLCGT
jgi:hypothetical protein